MYAFTVNDILKEFTLTAFTQMYMESFMDDCVTGAFDSSSYSMDFMYTHSAMGMTLPEIVRKLVKSIGRNTVISFNIKIMVNDSEETFIFSFMRNYPYDETVICGLMNHTFHETVGNNTHTTSIIALNDKYDLVKQTINTIVNIRVHTVDNYGHEIVDKNRPIRMIYNSGNGCILRECVWQFSPNSNCLTVYPDDYSIDLSNWRRWTENEKLYWYMANSQYISEGV